MEISEIRALGQEKILELAEKGAFGGAETLVFFHTGGVPALFSDSQAPFFYPAGETSGLPAV